MIPKYDPILDRYAEEIAESERQLRQLDPPADWDGDPDIWTPDGRPVSPPVPFIPVWRRRQQQAKDLSGQVRI